MSNADRSKLTRENFELFLNKVQEHGMVTVTARNKTAGNLIGVGAFQLLLRGICNNAVNGMINSGDEITLKKTSVDDFDEFLTQYNKDGGFAFIEEKDAKV